MYRTTRSGHKRALSRGGTGVSGHNLLSAKSLASILSLGSVGSILSLGSVLSIASAGSILSIGSSGSILSIGSVGSSPGREEAEKTNGKGALVA